MKKTFWIILVLCLAVAILAGNALRNANKDKPLYAADRVKIQLSAAAIAQSNLPEGMYAETKSFGNFELDRLLSQVKGSKIIRAHRRVNDTAWEQKTGFDRWFLIVVPTGSNISSVINTFKSSRLVEQAIPEYYAYTQLVPNDTYYPNNWGHNNTAQLPVYSGGSHSGAGVGTIGFDSHAQNAWNDTQGYGNPSIVIGIIDTGVDTAHPDLRLVAGYDFGDNDSNPMDDSADPGHGTSCSGVAAGIGNNNLGVAGMAAGCSVMPLKIASADGSLGFTAIENALTYAGDNGVDVGSMSFGASITYGSSPSTDTAVAYAYNHNVVLLAATANADASTIDYPACHPNVISIGAASPTGQRKSATSSDGEYWWGSNYGTAIQDDPTAVDICAPTILPTTDISGTGGYQTGNYEPYFNGTSCATPYAAGVAALILSKVPTLTPAQVRTAMCSYATDMTIDGGAGWDRYTGYGLVNAQASLASLTPGMPSISITSPASGTTFDLGTTIPVQVTATDPARSVSRVDFYLDGAATAIYSDNTLPYAWSWNTTGATGGAHTITATVVDNQNNTASAQISVSLLAPASEGFETGNFNAYTWTQSGNLPWTVQTADKYSGTYAAKSGAITHSHTSTMAVTLNITAAGNISFYQKVSSEATYDFLYFYIDSVQQGSWSGAGSWTMQSYAVTTGTHEFKWTYYKDGSVSTGSDCGFLDHITFPAYGVSTPPNITWTPSTITQTQETNTTGSQTLAIGNTGTQTLNYTLTKPTATTTILDETFATTTIPTGWTQANVTGTTNWVFAAGGYSSHPATAYDGAYNARLYYNSSTAIVTKLITPAMNILGATSASLSFWHTQELWSPDQDELRVYYRTSATGTWTLLTTYTSSIAAWTQETITLPNVGATYYIAFEGTAKYGYGVCVDKVVVTAQMGSVASWLSLNGGSTATGSISYGQAANNITVGFNTTGLANGNYSSTLTLTSNSDTNSSVTIPVSLTVAATPPSVPIAVTITNSGTNKILSWAASSGNPVGYKIYRSTLPDVEIIPANYLASVTAPVITYTDTSTAAATKYFYRIVAYK